jgi:HlyD family secretion protein
MKRPIVVVLILSMILGGAIFMKLRAQRAELKGPPTGSGVVEGTDVNIAAQISARVDKVWVKKGQSVKKGQLLISLDCSDVDSAIAEAEARLAIAEAQASGAKANRLAARRSTGVALAQAAAAKSRGEALAPRRSIAERNVARLANAGDGISVASVDQSQAEATALALEQQALLESAKASAAQASVAAAQGNAALANEAAADSAVSAAKFSLQRVRLQKRECELFAPRDATVEELFVEEGEVAGRGVALAKLIDIREVTVTFYVPNAELSAVTKSHHATVRADAYPDQSFDGLVTTVSSEAAFTPRNIQTRTDRDRLVYPVEVALNNEQGLLRPGMPVTVLLNTR